MAGTAAERAAATRGDRVQEVGRFSGNSFKVLNERGLAEMRKQIKERYKVDPETTVQEAADPRFSWQKFGENYEKATRGRLSEAQSASAQSQVLRYGITKLAGEGYELEPST